MNRLSSACSSLALLAAIALTGCQSKEKTAAAPAAASNGSAVRMGAVNDRCPISGMAVNPNVKTAAYKGDTIGFCCGMCPAKWDTMTPAEKDKFIAASKAAKATTTK